MSAELPRGWAAARLDELGRWGSGGTPKRGVKEYFGGTIPWLKIGDLTDGLVGASEETITETALMHSSARLVPPGTLVVAMSGSIGKLGVTTTECATNQAIAYCEVDDPVAVTRYVFWLLRYLRPELMASGKG